MADLNFKLLGIDPGKRHLSKADDVALDTSYIDAIHRVNYRAPDILEQLSIDASKCELPTPAPGQKAWSVPTYNAVVNYDMLVSEDADFVTFETEIARVRNPSPKFYGILHDINADTMDGKIVIERSVQSPDVGETCDSVYYAKQIRKYGVPKSTFIEEMVAFDYGVAKVFVDVEKAVTDGHAELLTGAIEPPLGLPTTNLAYELPGELMGYSRALEPAVDVGLVVRDQDR